MLDVPDRAIWLKERTVLSELPLPILQAIAQVTEEQTVQANRRLILEEQTPESLYILKSGQVESYRTSLNGPAWASSLLPGSIIHLQELLLDQPAQRTVITLTDCEFWLIPKSVFQPLAVQYPDLAQMITRQLATELAAVSSQLAYEQERQAALRPYSIAKARRGVVGSSRYAVRLRQQIKQAARDRKPVLIFGEPGLEKDNLSALIHFGSPYRRQPIIQVNSGLLQASGADLFGRVGGKPGLLEWLDTGTLILNNIQELPKDLFPQLIQLLETGTYYPVSRSDDTPGTPRILRSRMILISEKSIPTVERLVTHAIKVPPLRVRKSDIKAQVEYYINLICQARKLPRPNVTPEALRRLQAYNFPDNQRELQNLVERAIAQANGASELTEEVFWAAQVKKQQFRVNLLNAYPWLRQFLRSDWWPTRINYGFILTAFAIVVVMLFVGPQHRSENVALNLFWAWWWPLILVGFPFVGRLWCAVCPFMIYGEVVQKLSLWLVPRQLKRWPREEAEQWGGWFLFGLFTLIYLWEELWHLEDTAYLSSCLLLLITAGAVVCSLLFERRFWCRYLCPIGGMNGLFAKLSMIELRAQQGTCSAECTTYQCYKGGLKKGEGMKTEGCPLYSHPAQLEDNRDCVLCMTCLKACPHRSVELNLRPPGIELWTTHVPRSYEVALLLLLFGGIFLHRLPELHDRWFSQVPLDQFWPHFGVSVAVLAIAASLPAIAYGWMRVLPSSLKPRSFIELTYGYLPIVLGGNLAHYLRLGLGEAGRILPVTWATFGYSGESLPILTAHPAVIAFLQGTTILISVLLSLLLTQKIARQPIRFLLPQHFMSIGIGVCLWFLVIDRFGTSLTNLTH
jgi:transcriptional regulator with AAA-type ATPase domain/NAD-dependent dihydropyrimidine dehydrogenase PreA subunit